jgi:hypothetical protein
MKVFNTTAVCIPSENYMVDISDTRWCLSPCTDLAYRNGREEQNKCDCVSGSKKLKIPGAGSYLYTILLRFGVITAEPTD